MPERGFSRVEFEERTQAAQRMMREAQLDCMLLTTEANVRYFSGFLTQFWQSPTRPWYLLIPSTGKPIAVVPGIGEIGMRATWLDDIRCWPAPRPDDDGISLLLDTIAEQPRRFGRLGAPLGHGSHLRMPAQDFLSVRAMPGMELVDCSGLLSELCSIKSSAEIKKIEYACSLASDSFEALPDMIQTGDNEREIVRRMRLDLLNRGADDVPFMVSASGPDGYDNIIMGPVDRVLCEGDLLIIDTGAVFDGYFCDFDRNYAFGGASPGAQLAYDAVYRATDAGFKLARPGVYTHDLWRVMWDVLKEGGAEGNDVGRMGHGLGAQLTEWPSVCEGDFTELKPGMVITLEPGMCYDNGKQMVHEENIVITEDGARMLSRRAAEALPLIV